MADGYQIIAQHQSVASDMAGNLHDTMVVSFQTPDGTVGSVRIPLDHYNAETVAAAVAERAARISSVANL